MGKFCCRKDRIIEYPNGDICFGPGIVFITSEYEGEIVNDPKEVIEHRFFARDEIPQDLNRYDADIIIEWAQRRQEFSVKNVEVKGHLISAAA